MAEIIHATKKNGRKLVKIYTMCRSLLIRFV